ncbi:hypothetical protein GCM10010335_64080 [Streptomyces galbus]|nr:hypothetical protein GCM10010335_64080 [Streptomyces galbus]
MASSGFASCTRGASTARWLRGGILWNPNGHVGGPDPETLPLVDVLADLKQAAKIRTSLAAAHMFTPSERTS